MPTNLQIEFLENSSGTDYQVVKFTGEFDKAGYAEVKDRLDNFVQTFTLKNLIFDLHNLRFINSEGIGYLMEVHSHLTQRGRKLVLIGPVDHVKDVFKAIGITDIVPIFAEINDFFNNK